MTEKEKKRLLDRAAKLRPKPTLLPSGCWRCQVMANGKRESVTADTPELAHAKAIALKAELIAAEARLDRQNITLDDAITKYIEDRRAVLSPSTVRSYKETQKNRIQALLKMRVTDIDETALQIAIGTEAKAGKSTKTIRNDITLAVSVISLYKPVNTKQLKFPQRIKKEHRFLETKEIVALISACVGEPAEIPILLALWLGLRRSEILGLFWDCVDFDRKTISVHRTLVRDDTGSHVIKDFTKNESSRRVVSCPDYILDKLRAYPGERSGRVFKTNDTSFIYDNLKDICDREGITFPGVHGLRHTNATVMLSLGIMDKYAMARGGWSTDYTMKSVYQHLFEDDKTTADSLINSFFEGKIAHGIAHEK